MIATIPRYRKSSLVGKGLLLASALLGIWLLRAPLLDALSIIRDREAVVAYLQGHGAWGPVLMTAIISLQVLVATIPGHIFMIGGGYVYGFTVAFTVIFVSTVAASEVAFGLARTFGRPIVYRLAPAKLIGRWEKAAERQGFVFFLFAFILPIFPSDLMSYVAGLSSISPSSFFAANLLGRLPCAALMAMIGAYGFELPPLAWAIIVPVSAGMFLLWKHLSVGAEKRYLQQAVEEGHGD